MKNNKYNSLLLLTILCMSACTGSQPAEKNGQHAPVNYKLVEAWPRLPEGYVLGNPTGIGIDKDQHIFVFIRAGRPWMEPMPDSLISAKTILMLDRHSGKIIKSWGDHLFIMPHGLTVDKDNNVWVTDVGLQQIFKFDPEGKLIMKLGTAKVAGNDSAHFNLPTDVAIAKDGTVYISDGYENSRVVKFSSTGRYISEWGKKGDGPGEFNLPHAIDLDAQGNVYVADRENKRVQEFDPDGKFIKEWDSKSFGEIYSMTLDKLKGSLIAVDYEEDGSDIILFDSVKKQATQFGRSNAVNTTACRYHDVAIDDEGSIYVGDIQGNKIQKFVKVDREQVNDTTLNKG
jgi:peptidylamidoglycolate lyase